MGITLFFVYSHIDTTIYFNSLFFPYIIPEIFCNFAETRMTHMEQIQTNDKEIRIYQSIWKNTLLSILSLAIAAVGCYIIMHEEYDIRIKIVSGWLNVIFFGCGGLLILTSTIYNRIRHIPFLIIYEDRVEQYEQLKRTYYTFKFDDIRQFRFLNKSFTPNIIAVDYYSDAALRKQKKTSGLTQKIRSVNVWATGAMEYINANDMTIKGKDIYSILDARLKDTQTTGNKFPSCRQK